MRALLFSSLLLFLTTNIFAQDLIKGTITDKLTKKPLNAATIFIPDINRGTISDSMGNYIIKNLPKGKFLIEVSYLGYKTITQAIEVERATVMDFELEEAITEAEPVIVTGTPSASTSRNSPIPITTINKEELFQNASTNIIDNISKQPGISQISTGAAISKPVIRGLGYNRVITLYNGLKQEGQQWGDEHGIEMDEYSIDRVEVIKGPGSLMYGSDGIGGVLNFLTPKPLPEGEIKASVLSNYQTNNNLIGYSLMNAGNIKKVEWLARVSSKYAGDYSNRYDGKVFNSGFKEFDYNGYIGTTRKWGYSQLHFTSFSQKIAMPEGNRDSLGNFTKTIAINDTLTQDKTVTQKDLQGYKINVPYQFIRHNRIFLTNNILFRNSSLRFTLGYQLSRRQEFGDVLNPNQYGLFFYLPTWNYDIKYFIREYKGWKTTVGINGMYQQNRNKGIEFLIPDYNLFDAGIFLYTKKTIDKVTLSGGIRFDERVISTQSLYLGTDGLPTSSSAPGAFHKFSSFSNTYRNYSGSIGATYTVSEKLLLKVNAARGFRAPNIAELASNGRHEGTFRYEYGNSLLKAETSLQLDAGINYETDHVTMDISVFNNNINHYIYAVRLRNKVGGDSIVDPAEPVPTYKYGQNNAVLTGGEAVLDIHPRPLDWLHFENSFSIVRGINKHLPDSSKYLPFMPAPRYRSRLKANIKKKMRCADHLSVYMEADHFFAQNQYLKENHTETATPGYTLINAGFGGNILNKKGEVMLSIYFSANNMFNIAYQNHLNRLKYAPINPVTGRMGIYNMGRNFSIKVIVPVVVRKKAED